MRPLRSTLTVSLGTLAILATALAPATAAIVERGDIHLTPPPRTITDFCGVEGLTVDVASTIDGRFQVNSRGPGGPDYYMEGIRVVDVYTDRDTQLTATDISPHIIDKDLAIV